MQIVNKYRLYPTKDRRNIIFNIKLLPKIIQLLMDLRQRYYKNYKYSMSYTEQSRTIPS